MENDKEYIQLSDTRREMRKFAKRIDKIVKDEIRAQDLIQTGNMLRSIKSKVTVGSMDQMNVEVDAIEYFKYINGDFKVLDKAFRSAAYKSVQLDFIIFTNRFKSNK
tara:strand:- start:946 stop:1266 length:321 start_codon:yes stop_codon:yes gene_type:complete